VAHHIQTKYKKIEEEPVETPERGEGYLKRRDLISDMRGSGKILV
jgi:hypothetical protein